MDSLLPIAKGLAHQARLRILRILDHGPFTVNELVDIVRLGQSGVSHHLKVLSEAGLVEGERHGAHVFYSLPRPTGEERAADRVLPWLTAELAREGDPDGPAVAACLQRRAERSRRFFSEKARDWEGLRDRIMGPLDYLDRLAEAVEGCPTVVDLGTGTGTFLRHLGPRVREAIGVDASAEMLEMARGNVGRWGLSNVDLRLGALEHLPLGDGEADGAVANMVLHHLDHPSRGLAEIRRVLRRGGALVVAELAPHDQEAYRDLLGDHWLGLEPERLRGWVAEAGFSVGAIEELKTQAGGDGSEPRRPGAYMIRARASA
jgi:ArsR family transcriptional regulator